MKMIVLPLETAAQMGVNRKVVLTYKDFTSWQGGVALTSTTAQAFVPENGKGLSSITMRAGTQVSNFLVNLTVPFVGSACAFTIGDGGSANRFATTFDATGAAAWKAVGVPTEYLYVAADTIDITVTAATMANLTAGEVEIYFNERDLTGLPYVTQP
jgi:hypothetical protein